MVNKITESISPIEQATKINEIIDDKQDTLVSGTNIKTINNTSLLGSGNIDIQGGGTATDVQINGTSITSSNVANIVTNSAYNSSTNKIATMSDLPDISNCANTTLSNLSSTSCTNFDGQWVNSYKEISTSGAAGAFTINLGNTGTNPKNYFPQDIVDDGYSYLVQFVSFGSNSSNSGTANLHLVIGNNEVILNSAGKGAHSNNSFFVVVDSSRSFNMSITTGFNSFRLYAIGYRRVGTNT